MNQKRGVSKQIFTIPNLLSFLRLLMIPWILWLYSVKHLYGWAAFAVLLSGLTDMADGFIARRFNMISDFGKILDPIADKATQAALIFALTSRYPAMWVLLGLLVIKEVTQAVVGLLVVKKEGRVHGAQWFGKLCTVVLYSVIILLLLLPDLSSSVVKALILLCGVLLLFSFLRYLFFFVSCLTGKEK